MRSNGPTNRNAAASARAVANVSEPANAASVTWIPSVAPNAIASRRTSSADAGPSVTAVHDAAGVARQLDPLGHGPAVVRAHLER